MIAILTVLVALPLGLLVRRRVVAFLAYGLAFAHVFTFQTAVLLLEWSKGSHAAFARSAGDDNGLAGVPWGYLLTTTLIYAVGMALVALGAWLRSRRSARHAAGGALDLATAS